MYKIKNIHKTFVDTYILYLLFVLICKIQSKKLKFNSIIFKIQFFYNAY